MAVTTPTIRPLTLKDLDLIFGVYDVDGVTPVFTDGVNYKKHVDQVELAPSVQTGSWTGGGMNTHTDVSPATWQATIGYAQDWDTEGSLSEYLFDNEGDRVPIKLQPRTGSGSSFVINAIIAPGAIGGQLNQVGTRTTATLGVDGKPTRVPAA